MRTPARLLLLLLLAALLPRAASAPLQPVQALAPVEIVMAGFGNLRGIALDADGNIHVADREAGTVTRIAPDHTRTTVASGLERPVGLALDLAGRLLIAEERAGRVVRVEAGGHRTPIMSGIKQPRWLAVSDDGTVYVSARRLTRDSDPEPDDESAEPEIILALSPSGQLRVFAGDFRRLQGLTVADGAVFAATTGRRDARHADGVIFRIPILADGSAGSPIPLGPADQFKKPVGLVTDRLGSLYFTTKELDVADDPAKQAVGKLHPDGALTLFASLLDDPQGLDIDAAGNLYVADGRSGRVIRFLAPPPPVIATPPRFTSQASLTVSGTTEAAARLHLFVNDAPVALTGTADAAGAFVLTAALTPNSETQLEVFATARGGRGLTSAPADASLTHDAVVPTVVFQAPPAGAFVRESAPVQAQASDRGSSVAGLVVTAPGPSLVSTLAPAPPAPTVAAAATWNTLAVPDGTHTLGAAATDRAGNSAGISRVVIVDNTPPDTRITGGPTGSVSETAATFGFIGADNLTPVPSLVFAWRVDGGAYSAFSAATSTTLTGLPPGDHTFEVKSRDLAGNEDPTPARQIFSLSTLRVTITQPADRATVPAGVLLVRGTVEGAGADPAVSVDGLAASVTGAQWAAEVPIAPGLSAVSVSVMDPSGAQASAAITVTASQVAQPLVLRAVPARGVAPLEVTWQVSNQTGRRLIRFELDATGAGAFGAPTATFDGVQTTYTSPGLVFPALRATDDLGTTYLATTLVQVDDARTATNRFQGLWTRFKSLLQAGDQAGALAQLAPTLRPRLQGVFQQLAADLPAIAASLGDLLVLEQVGDLAETALVQQENGAPMLHFVYFRRDSRGQWLIEEM